MKQHIFFYRNKAWSQELEMKSEFYFSPRGAGWKQGHWSTKLWNCCALYSILGGWPYMLAHYKLSLVKEALKTTFPTFPCTVTKWVFLSWLCYHKTESRTELSQSQGRGLTGVPILPSPDVAGAGRLWSREFWQWLPVFGFVAGQAFLGLHRQLLDP